MYMLKLFRNYRSGPPWLLGKQPTSWGTAKDYRLGTSGGIRAFVCQGRDRRPPTLANCPGQECCSFFHLILPESQSPHRTLFIPCYKKSGLEREGKMVCQGVNPPLLRSPAI